MLKSIAGKIMSEDLDLVEDPKDKLVSKLYNKKVD